MDLGELQSDAVIEDRSMIGEFLFFGVIMKGYYTIETLTEVIMTQFITDNMETSLQYSNNNLLTIC